MKQTSQRHVKFALATECCRRDSSSLLWLVTRILLSELRSVSWVDSGWQQLTWYMQRRCYLRIEKSLELIATNEIDRPLSIQIFGSKPDVLAAAALWLEDHGYTGVDINMGCPMAKVNGQGGGARITCEYDSACELVSRVV